MDGAARTPPRNGDQMRRKPSSSGKRKGGGEGPQEERHKPEKPEPGQPRKELRGGKRFEDEMARVDHAFNDLPELDGNSAEYIEYIRNKPPEDLPPQVLARAFRQLPAGSPAADATLTRLLGDYDKTGYLETVWTLARRWTIKRRDVEVEDLFQATIVQVLATLGDEQRGEMAEKWWISYLKREFTEATRKLFGRRQTKVDPELDVEGEEADEDVGHFDEVSDEEVLPLHGKADSYGPWLADFLERVVDGIVEPMLQKVARHLITGDKVVKTELAKELGITRWVLEPLLQDARAKLKAAIDSQDERPNFSTDYLDE